MTEVVWPTAPLVVAWIVAVLGLVRFMARRVGVVVGGGDFADCATRVPAGVAMKPGQVRAPTVWNSPLPYMESGWQRSTSEMAVSIRQASSCGHPGEVLLAALGKDYFTSQTFADHEGATRRPSIRHGRWRTQQHQLEADNAEGMGIFFTVSHTDLRGRTAANVTAIAAYFADFDGASLPRDWPLPPTAIVESSEGRYHVYWRVLGALLDAFRHVQKHVSVLFGSDPTVHDLPRVLRVPGMVHAKGEPFRSRLILVEPDNVVEHDVFVDAFCVPPMETVVRQAPIVPAGSDRLRLYVWSAVQGEHDCVAATGEGARNRTLHGAAVRLGTLVGAGVLSEVDARDALLAAALAAGLPYREAVRTIASGIAYGVEHPRPLGGGAA